MLQPINYNSLNNLLHLMSIKKLNDLKKYAKTLVITKNEFVTLSLCAKLNDLESFPYLYKMHYVEHIPKHLFPTEKDHLSLTHTNGLLDERAKKVVSRITQLFKERKWTAGHLFYTPNYSYWHLFYFEIKDLNEEDNHWKKGGRHLHYISDLWPNYNMNDIWQLFCSGSKDFGDNVHIRFN